MNKAETGESSLDDTVAVPAKEVAWGLAYAGPDTWI